MKPPVNPVKRQIWNPWHELGRPTSKFPEPQPQASDYSPSAHVAYQNMFYVSVYVYIYTIIHVFICVWVCPRMYAWMCLYIHTIHTYIHIYICYTCIQACRGLRFGKFEWLDSELRSIGPARAPCCSTWMWCFLRWSFRLRDHFMLLHAVVRL